VGGGVVVLGNRSCWPQLNGQVLLGSEAFVDKMRPLLECEGEFKKIPRSQRWAHGPGSKSLFSERVRQDKPAREAAMRRACLEYG
jgi:putative transposase